jgi:hypothetical protein
MSSFVDFHVFHASHRFGPFFYVFHEFFVLFFVPAEREKARFSWGNSSDVGHLGDGKENPGLLGNRPGFWFSIRDGHQAGTLPSTQAFPGGGNCCRR